MMESKLTLLVGCFAGILLVSSGYTLEANGDKSFAKVSNTLDSELELKVDADDITTDSCYLSSEVELYSIPWKVKLCKSKDKELKISLFSVFDDNLSKLSCQVKGEIQILHKENGEPLKGQFKDLTFKKAKQEHALIAVKWSEFKEKYVKDDEATFKFSLYVQRPVLIQTLEHSSTKFQLQVFDVFNDKGTKSPNIILRGVKWYVWAVPYVHNGIKMFAVFVGGNASDMDINSSYKVETNIKLWSNKKSRSTDYTYNFVYEYHWRSSLYGAVDFIPLDDLKNSNNKFIFEDNAVLEIKLTVHKPQILPQ